MVGFPPKNRTDTSFIFCAHYFTDGTVFGRPSKTEGEVCVLCEIWEIPQPSLFFGGGRRHSSCLERREKKPTFRVNFPPSFLRMVFERRTFPSFLSVPLTLQNGSPPIITTLVISVSSSPSVYPHPFPIWPSYGGSNFNIHLQKNPHRFAS